MCILAVCRLYCAAEAMSAPWAAGRDDKAGRERVTYSHVGEDVAAPEGPSLRRAPTYASAAPALATTSDVSGVTMYGVFSSLTTVKDAASSQWSYTARPCRSVIVRSTW